MKGNTAAWLMTVSLVAGFGACSSSSGSGGGGSGPGDGGGTNFDGPSSSSGGSSGGGSSSGAGSSSGSGSSGGNSSGSSSGTGSSSGSTPGDAGADGGPTFLPDVTLPGTPAGPGALGVDSATNTAYIALDPWMLVQDDAGQTVRLDGVAVVDIASGTVTTTVPLPGLLPLSVAVDSTAHKVYVSAIPNGGSSASLTVIDGTTNTVSGSPIPGAGLGDPYLVVDPAANKVFGYDGTSHLDVYDVSAMSFVQRITMSGYDTSLFGNTAGGLDFDPASQNLWVLGPAGDDAGIPTSSLLTVVDRTTYAVGTQTPYPGAPTYLGDDQASTGNVFVATTQAAVIDGPISLKVPPNYDIDFVMDCPQNTHPYAAWMYQKGSAGYVLQYFDASGNPAEQYVQQGAGEFFAGGWKKLGYEVHLVETTVNGSPQLLQVLRRVNGDC